jgi:Fusaric acid resistance protein-like
VETAATLAESATVPLFGIGPARPAPAIRRGLLLSVPVGVILLLELGLELGSRGGIATGALLAGFVAMEAPALTRSAWQAAVAPMIGLGAALGALTANSAPLAIVSLAVVGMLAGYCSAVSLRFAIAGLNVALALLITQGLPVTAADAPEAFLFGTMGGLAQAAFSLIVYAAGERASDSPEDRWSTSAAVDALKANLTPRSESFQHGLRLGIALGAAVAAYWLIGFSEHGFWIPLTVLFVLRPDYDTTFDRLVLRAVGTLIGLVIATALSEWLHGDGVALAVVLAIATGFAYGMLTVQYALFTTAITSFAVLLADTLGDPALVDAEQRGLATVVGILITFVVFLAWPSPQGAESGWGKFLSWEHGRRWR